MNNVLLIVAFAVIMAVALWSLALIIKIEKLEKKLITHERFTSFMESAKEIASEAEKNSATKEAKEKFHNFYLMFQMLYDACKSPNIG